MAPDINEVEQLRSALADAKAQIERDQATIAALCDAMRQRRSETQHQTRNILSVVRSIARRTVAEGEAAQSYQARLDSRLAAFTRVQSKILLDPAAGLDLGTLVADELLAFGIGLGDGAQVEGPSVCLKPKPASVLGLAFHELALMAIESGDPASDAATTDVRWRIDGDGDGAGAPRLTIEWLATGWALDGSALSSSTFAHEAVEQAVAYELGGVAEVDVVDGTLHCRFHVPATCLASS